MDVYCKVISASDDWLRLMSTQCRVFVYDHEDYYELREIDDDWMTGQARECLLKGTLCVLTSKLPRQKRDYEKREFSK